VSGTRTPNSSERTTDEPSAAVRAALGPERGHGPGASDVDEATLAAVLAEAGRILGATLDVGTTLRQIAGLVVPRIADWCAIDLLEPDGSLRPLTLAHRDAERMALVERLRRRYPPDPGSPVGTYAAVRTGRSMIIAEIDDEMLRAGAKDEQHLELLRSLQLRSWLAAPMRAAGQILGTISLAHGESGRTFGDRHVVFVEDLAARAGAALANARAYQAADRDRRILDAVAEAVFIIEPDGRIHDVNQGAARLLGRPAESLVEDRLWDLVETTDPDAIRQLTGQIVDGRATTRTASADLRKASGERVPVEILLQRVDLAGDGDHLVAIARDMSERIEAQSRLQRLAEAEHARAAELNAVIRAMGEGVVVCGPGGRITLANPAARGMFPGASPTTYADIVAELHDPDRRAPGLGAHAGPVALATRRDRDRWIEVSTYPVDADGSRGPAAAGETIIVLRDVTEQRQREAVRETFIGVLSHELRTPITTIYGGSRILSRQDTTLDDDTRRAIFRDIADEAERLQRLVEDVVALNRFGEDDGELGQEPVLLQRIVPGVVASEEPRWPAVRFTVRVPAGLPTVVADPTYVEQVVRNLVSNAAKYGGTDASVEVILEPTDEEVAVRVLDDGPGIEPDEADRLFELFYRSPVTASATSGAGIGLFVCARLVRAMGGRIWARSRPGGGAEVGFALRVMQVEAE
jgi:PAS domain S-box-containing protein